MQASSLGKWWMVGHPSLRTGLRVGRKQVWEEDAEAKSGQAEFGVGHQGKKPSRPGAKRRGLIGDLRSPWHRDRHELPRTTRKVKQREPRLAPAGCPLLSPHGSAGLAFCHGG